MAGWDDEPSTNTGGGWNSGFAAPEEPSKGFDAGPAPGGEEGGNVGFGAGEETAAGGGGDNACRYCKEEGHFARECPNKPASSGACFNCGEDGHNKAECPNPRKFTGTCRVCSKEGHSARECPERPPEMCRNCREEGHVAKECKNNRFIDRSHIADRTQVEAWKLMENASKEDDFDAFKEHMLEYMKATPNLNLDEMELALRGGKLNYYLYALEMDEVPYDKVIVGFHGQTGPEFKYVWSLNRTAKPRRSKTTGRRMAADPDENMRRLRFAGTIEDDNGPFCHTCKHKGHVRRECEVEQVADEFERVVLKCTNCESLDHRLRDCPQPRKVAFNPNTCRNCGEEGHKSAECEKPRVADEKTQCRKCDEYGHFSRDCPNAPDRPPQTCFNCHQEGHRSSDCPNERVMKCRNCDEIGHGAKECSKPRDMSRVKCNLCGEMGHYQSRCPNPAPAEEAEYGNGGEATRAVPNADAPAATMGLWGQTAAPVPAIDAGGWGGNDW